MYSGRIADPPDLVYPVSSIATTRCTVHSIRAPNRTPRRKKEFAWLWRFLRKAKRALWYRVGFIHPRDEAREAIGSIDDLREFLEKIRDGTEFRWGAEHLAELIEALENSPYFQNLPHVTKYDLEAFHNLRQTLLRARQISLADDRTEYADYINELLRAAATRLEREPQKPAQKKESDIRFPEEAPPRGLWGFLRSHITRFDLFLFLFLLWLWWVYKTP